MQQRQEKHSSNGLKYPQCYDLSDDEDEGDDEEDDDEDGGGLCGSSPSSSPNLASDDDVISLSLSFLLPVHTDLCAGLNCHVTFLAVVEESESVDVFTDGVAMGLEGNSPKLDSTAVSGSFCSSSLSGSISGSGGSSYKSQSGSTGGRLERAAPEDLGPEAEVLEGRLGSVSDRSESQSLSPATDPHP